MSVSMDDDYWNKATATWNQTEQDLQDLKDLKVSLPSARPFHD